METPTFSPPSYPSEPRSPIRSPTSPRTGNADTQAGRPKHIDLSLGAGERLAAPPLSPVRINGSPAIQPYSARIETLSAHSRTPSAEHPPAVRNFSRVRTPDAAFRTSTIRSIGSTSFSSLSPPRQPERHSTGPLGSPSGGERMADQFQMASKHADSPQIIATDENGTQNLLPEIHELGKPKEPEPVPQLQYFHQRGLSEPSGMNQPGSDSTPGSHPDSLARPMSALALDDRSRSASPGLAAPRRRDAGGRTSTGIRPKSYIEQLNAPYVEAAPTATNLVNDTLRPSVGLNASLLSSKQTFEMYKANIKKTPDQKVQYDFALFMIQAATEARSAPSANPSLSADSPLADPGNLVKEARKILEKLASNSYPFAQYYLADGLASGTFTKNGEPDDGAAFPLFVSASKHGHAEAGYRAGLCYEYGWGCSKSGPRSEQFFRASASKGHPGSMARLSRACLSGDLGNDISEREGVRWLRRAADAADAQFNDSPYLLARLHETGFGSDVFKDLPYAATLYTRAAELGHAEAAYRMGRAYEHAELECPNDPPLSVHFYTLAAQQGHAEAMMGLVAWYMVGAPGFLEPDETEAFEWSKLAAATGLPKAAYAYAYFYESGVGCRRDPLEANKWYVRAAEMGEERAKLRLRMLRDAASGRPTALPPVQNDNKKSRNKSQSREDGEGGEKKKKFGIF